MEVLLSCFEFKDGTDEAPDHNAARSEYTQIGIIIKKARPEEYSRRLILSSLWEEWPFVGIIFLKTMLDDTKTMAEPKADSRPIKSDADTSNEHASMTPNVSGNKER
jgi:hypothetical protein